MRTTLDTPNDSYHQNDGHISRSTIHMAYRWGPVAYRHMLNGIRLFKGSAATNVGQQFDEMVETLIMRGIPLDEQLATPPSECLTTNGQRRGKKYIEWLTEIRAAGKQPASVDDAERFGLMSDALMRNSAAWEIVSRTTHSQRSVWWNHEGHDVKARFDGETDDGIWDLKTTSADWDSLPRKAWDLGYVFQAAHYTAAAKAAGIPCGEAWDMPFVFVQTVPPYRCKVVTFPPDACRFAADKILETLEWMKQCRESGDFWTPEDNEISEMQFPAYITGGFDHA